MGTNNYDASVLTQRKRAAALNSFYVSNQAAVNAGTSVRREQPSTQLNEVLLQRQTSVAATNPGASCPCSTYTGSIPGGGNGNNVQ